MQDELDVMEANRVWQNVSLPTNKQLANGCIRSNPRKMALLINKKLDWWQKRILDSLKLIL